MAQKQLVTVELDASELQAIKELAIQHQETVEEMIARAVRDYLSRRSNDTDEWRRRWNEAVASIRSGVPDTVTPEEIEADVRAARAEYRAERRARNSR